MNDHIDDLLALHALGGLEVEAAERIEAHLSQCAACRREADEMETLVAAIAVSVPARTPPERVRAALLLRLAAPQPAARPARLPPDAKAPRRLAGWLRRLAPAALVAALIGLAAWNLYLTTQLARLRQLYGSYAAAVALISSPATESFPLQAQGEYPLASGRAYVDAQTNSTVLVVERMGQLREGQTYQAWFITPEGPVSAGLFTVARSGWGMTWLALPYREGSAVGVSLEPEGVSPHPSEVVLLGGM
jgi:anti-sigma-K factor RskA